MAKKLTSSERERIAVLITELDSRGIDTSHLKVSLHTPFVSDRHGYFSKLDGTLYSPTDEQGAFVKSDARFVGFFGGRGSGKSAAGAQKAVKKISQGYNGAVLNPDFENFKLSTWPEFREWIPWDNVVDRHRYMENPEWQPHQPFVLAFKNRVRVICKGLKDPDSARGPNINWLWYDEPGRDKDGLAWQIAIASVRVGELPQAWATTTPKGKYHWLYKFFIDQDIPEEALELFAKEESGRELIEAFAGSIYDNQQNLDPGFMASMLAAYPAGYLRDQEIFGKFVTEGGTLGDRTWFNGKIIPYKWETVKKRLRYWDLAASEKKITGKKKNDPDETVGSLLSWKVEDETDHFAIEHQLCGHWEWKDIKTEILRVAETDGPYIPICVEQEPGAGGKNQVAEIELYIHEKLGKSWKIVGHRPEGDKVMRANAWFAEAAEGKFYLVQGNWNDGFLDQLDSFPEDKHDDRVDSVSGARQIIAPFKTWSNIKFLHL